MPVLGEKGYMRVTDVFRRMSVLGPFEVAVGDTQMAEFLAGAGRITDLDAVVADIRGRCALGIMECGGQFGVTTGQLREDLTALLAGHPALQALQIEPFLV